MTSTLSLSIVIPAYNEQSAILDSLRRIEAYSNLRQWDWEIIIASDGATDKTDRYVRSVIDARKDERIKLFGREQHRGKGDAVRRGVLGSSGELILVTDAGLLTPIKEADKLLAVIQSGADVAVGSRALRAPGCDVLRSRGNYLSDRFFNFIVRSIALPGIRDTQCGFTCFRSSVAKELFGAQRFDRHLSEIEILYLARKRGYQISEVPVMWCQGESRSETRRPWNLIGELYQLRKVHG